MKQPSAILLQILDEERGRRVPRTWQHPIHARGIKSQDMSRCHVGDELTDLKIKQYALRGRYSDIEPFQDPVFVAILQDEKLGTEERHWKLRQHLKRKYRL